MKLVRYGLPGQERPGVLDALGRVRVKPGFKLTPEAAAAWVEGGFDKP